MEYIEEYGNTYEKNIQEIYEHIKNNKLCDKLECSYVYDDTEKINSLHTELRKSKSKILKDNFIFDKLDVMIHNINIDNDKKYVLLRDQCNYISYEAGDYFGKHTDYISIKTNIFDEYKLLICLDAKCDGGNTIFYINDNFKYISNSSTLNNNMIIFKKDILHEGEIIKNGYKIILTANLLSAEKSAKIIEIIFDNKEFVFIDSNKIVNFDNKIYKEIESKNLLVYKEPNELIDKTKFEIIIDILYGKSINLEQYTANKDIFDYYEFKNIKLYDKCNNIENLLSAKDLILCKHEDEFYELSKFIDDQNLNYIPFKTFLIEGTVFLLEECLDGDGCYHETKIELTNILSLFGDNDSVLFMKSFNHLNRNYKKRIMYKNKYRLFDQDQEILNYCYDHDISPDNDNDKRNIDENYGEEKPTFNKYDFNYNFILGRNMENLSSFLISCSKGCGYDEQRYNHLSKNLNNYNNYKKYVSNKDYKKIIENILKTNMFNETRSHVLNNNNIDKFRSCTYGDTHHDDGGYNNLNFYIVYGYLVFDSN
jgi:hypothetical protein